MEKKLSTSGPLRESADKHSIYERLAYHYSNTDFAWFKKLQMPRYVERTEQLAQEYGVTLTEVELEELMEGLP